MSGTNPESYDEPGVIALIRAARDRAGSMRALAREWGVGPSYISDLLDGRRAPGPKILGPLGLERVRTVRYVAKGDRHGR